MIRTYKTQINIAVTADEVWETITQAEFTSDFLPEISRNPSKLTLFKLAMHRNALKVMPAYMVDKKTISWDSNANTSIELARKDLAAEINNVDISLRDNGHSTSVSIEVHYTTQFNATFLQTERAVRGLFNRKLNVLKQDLESTTQQRHQLQAAYN